MNNKETFFEIAGRKIGYNFDPLIIAEIGINHGGSLELAKAIVDAAKSGGAEVIKHQTHIVEDEMTSAAKNVIPGHTKTSIYEIMESCALNESDEIELKKYVEKSGMIFMSSPFSRAAADRLRRMDVPAYKIGSGECNNYPLLEHIASFGKPIILSTGMNSIESVRKAVAIFESNNIPYALLHCTNIYPTPPNLVRLGAMVQLQEEFPNAVVGLSDHTTNNLACLGAVALGASVLERHFTDSMSRVGPDIVCSMDPKALSELIDGAKILKQERGGEKSALKEEQATIDFAYASVVTISSIKKGETFTKENLWVKRPGTGEILAEEYKNILGKIATQDIPNDELLKLSFIQ
jgi:N-acetylneuraminate synthase